MEARGLYRRPASAFESTNPAFTEENCRRSEKLALMPTFPRFSLGEAPDVVTTRIASELRGLHEEVAFLARARVSLIKRAGASQRLVCIGPAVGQLSGIQERDFDVCLAGLDCELKELGRMAGALRVSEMFRANARNLANAVDTFKAARHSLSRLVHMSRSVGMRPPSNEDKKKAELTVAEKLRKLRDAVCTMKSTLASHNNRI